MHLSLLMLPLHPHQLRLSYVSSILLPSLLATSEASTPESIDLKQHIPSLHTYIRNKDIMTLGILAPYRRHGLATKLLDHVIAEALKTRTISRPRAPAPPEPTPTPVVIESKKTIQKGKKAMGQKTQTSETSKPVVSKETIEVEEEQIQLPRLTSVYVHVQFGNEEARAFYGAHGFEVEGEVKDYYRKIEPRDAWVLSKALIQS